MAKEVLRNSTGCQTKHCIVVLHVFFRSFVHDDVVIIHYDVYVIDICMTPVIGTILSSSSCQSCNRTSKQRITGFLLNFNVKKRQRHDIFIQRPVKVLLTNLGRYLEGRI